jgi:hypothetical protein
MNTTKKGALLGFTLFCIGLVGCAGGGLEVVYVETDWISNHPHHQLGGCEEFIQCPDGMKVLSGGLKFRATTVDDRIFVKDSHPSDDRTGWCHLVANDTDKTIEYKVCLVCGRTE